MSTLKEIGNKLFKDSIELKSHKVELAVVDDIQKMFNMASKELSNATNSSKKAIAALDEVFTAYRQSAIASNQVINAYTDLAKQAKDLGIPLPSNIEKFKADSDANLKATQAKMSSIQNAKKLI